MISDDKRFIRIDLDDAIIQAADENGEEFLRLAIKIEGHQVLIRFPSHGNWDFFTRDCAQFFATMARNGGDIQINGISNENYQAWAYITSQIIQFKACRELIDKIFFDYLEPTVPDLFNPDLLGNNDECKAWLRKHMRMNHLFYMFQSILLIDDWLKKKAMTVLVTTFPNLTGLFSRDTLPKNSTFQSTVSSPVQPFSLD